MSNSKCVYYKEKEQKSFDGGITWVDTGNFRKGALVSTQASQCGSYTNEYRWIKADYVCDNANKYNGYKQQVSYDNGGSWVDTGVVDIGDLIETNSKDCGYDERWFTLTGDNDFICDGSSKYKKKEMKYTRNSGTTWNSFDSPKYEKGDLIEENSSDCPNLSMKVTYVDGTTKYFTGLTSIEKDTDPNKVNAKSVEIYDGVKIIGEHAFDECSSLTSVTIPNSVTSIEKFAFDECRSLTGITIPDSVTSIGDWAFWGCNNLVSATLPNGITIIPNWAFHHCYNLTGITIPNSVTSIENYAFADCKSLTGITIPNSVTSIGQGAFEECPKLTEMTVKATTPPSLDHYAFYNSGIQTIYVPADSLDAYKSAWDEYGNSYADKILPIGASMKVTYTDGSTKYFTDLTNIENNTDSNKSNAKSVEIYDSVTRIGYRAFYECSSLTGITIPNSVTSIGESVFWNCSSLISITLPLGIELISGYLFYNCENLESVTLPDSVKSIGDNAFYGCTSLSSITIPDSVTSIGSYAFRGTNLTSLTLPASLTSIGYYAFANCTSLSSITIPDSVTSIGDRAFYDCSALTSITVNAVTPPSLGESAIPSNIQRIYVPASSVDSYKSADGWKDYADKIQAIS